jgi:hypothetical protein
MPETITLLKNDGRWVYSDYSGPERAQLRLADLQTDLRHDIMRTYSTPLKPELVVAILLSADYYNSILQPWQVANAPTPAMNLAVVPDDYLGNNLSLMANYIQGKAQTPDQALQTANLGLSVNGYVGYEMIDTQIWEEVQDNSALKGGKAKAYLVHPDWLNFVLTAVITSGSYVGVGNGTLSGVQSVPANAVAETITITALSASSFSVVGSVSGALPNAAVGVPYSSSVILFQINAGSVAFSAGDAFVITAQPVPL